MRRGIKASSRRPVRHPTAGRTRGCAIALRLFSPCYRGRNHGPHSARQAPRAQRTTHATNNSAWYEPSMYIGRVWTTPAASLSRDLPPREQPAQCGPDTKTHRGQEPRRPGDLAKRSRAPPLPAPKARGWPRGQYLNTPNLEGQPDLRVSCQLW